MVIVVGIVAGPVIRKTVVRTPAPAAIVPEYAPGGDDHGDEAEQIEENFHASSLPRIERGGYGVLSHRRVRGGGGAVTGSFRPVAAAALCVKRTPASVWL